MLKVFFQFLSVGFKGQHAIEDDTKETWVRVVLQLFSGEGDDWYPFEVVRPGCEAANFALSDVDCDLPNGTPGLNDIDCSLYGCFCVFSFPCGAEDCDVVCKECIQNVIRKVFGKIVDVK